LLAVHVGLVVWKLILGVIKFEEFLTYQTCAMSPYLH